MSYPGIFYYSMIPDSRGFPWPLDKPYKLDPDTGYPTPEVSNSH